jgi:hypothetical protein
MVLLTNSRIPIVVIQHPYLLQHSELQLLVPDEDGHTQCLLQTAKPTLQPALALVYLALLD